MLPMYTLTLVWPWCHCVKCLQDARMMPQSQYMQRATLPPQQAGPPNQQPSAQYSTNLPYNYWCSNWSLVATAGPVPERAMCCGYTADSGHAIQFCSPHGIHRMLHYHTCITIYISSLYLISHLSSFGYHNPLAESQGVSSHQYLCTALPSFSIIDILNLSAFPMAIPCYV